jgi:hypothetical protein
MNKTRLARLFFMLISGTMLTDCAKQYVSIHDAMGAGFAHTEGKVAPLFLHGPGEALVAQWTFTPPVFFEEREASQLIAEELQLAGIVVDYSDVLVDDLTLKGRDGTIERDSWILDGYSSESNIGFEFVSKADFHMLMKPHSGLAYREDYYMVGAAEAIRSKFLDYGKIVLGVFYDPLVPVDEYLIWIREHPASVASVAEKYTSEQLRLQVKDFIAWLRQEGYLEPGDGEGE